MGELVWLGVSLISIGCLSSAIGLLAMKWSATVEADRPLHRRVRWWFGFLFLVVNATAIDVVAFGITPLSLIAPFAGLTIVFTALLASTGWLHVREALSPADVACIAVVLLGVTLVSVYGPHPADELPLSQMMQNFLHPQFVAFSASTLTTVVAWLVVWKAPPCARCRPAPDGPVTTLLSAFTAAVCGALSQLFLKIVSVAIKVQVEGSGAPWRPGDATYPLAWAALLGLAATAPTQLYLLNTTLASSTVALSVPLYQSLMILLTVTAGGIFFREFDDASAASMAVFGLSVLLVMAGLGALSLHQETKRAAAAAAVAAAVTSSASAEPPPPPLSAGKRTVGDKRGDGINLL